MAQRFVTGARTGDHLARPDEPDSSTAQARRLREARDEVVRARRLLDLEDWTGNAR
jgi:aminopeptidase N